MNSCIHTGDSGTSLPERSMYHGPMKDKSRGSAGNILHFPGAPGIPDSNDLPLRDDEADEAYNRIARDIHAVTHTEDIMAFLLAELDKMLPFATKGKAGKRARITSLSDEARNSLASHALDRALTGFRLTGPSRSGTARLRLAGREYAGRMLEEFLDDGYECPPTVGEYRRIMTDFYQRFLLWGRTFQYTAIYPPEDDRGALESNLGYMAEMIEILMSFNGTYPADLPMPEGPSPNVIAREYGSALEYILRAMPMDLFAASLPARGWDGTRGMLEKRRYLPSLHLYELDIRLEGLSPRIHRRLSVPGNRSLADLHRAIQIAFGWEDAHLHEFEIEGTRYGEPGLDEDREPLMPDSAVTLDRLSLSKGESFLYTYDLGDDWRHRIRVAGRTRLSGDDVWLSPVRCLEGARASPPEDCGGAPGYAELLRAVAQPLSRLSEDDADLVRWAGSWNPDKFNMEAVNKKLSKL